ncbi:MAG: hypothetical protein ACTHJ3_02665 [Pararhizobium sp.]
MAPALGERRDGPKPMKAASVAAILLFIFGVACARAADHAVGSGAETTIQALFGDTHQTAAYETAMTRYEVDLANRLKPVQSAVFLIPQAQSEVWTWFSGDGGAVRRTGRGTFRITIGNCLRNFCSLVDCQDAGWPLFQCSDGATRRMSAPDGETVVFGEVTYRRPPDIGTVEAGRAEELPQETKKPAAGGGAAGFN